MRVVRCRTFAAVIAAAISSSFLSALLAQQPEDTPDVQARKSFSAGDQAERDGDLIRAESDYRQVLGISLVELGLIHHTLGNLDRAELAYLEATQAVSNSDVALEGLAVVYLRKGEFDKGVQTVKLLLDQNPFNGGARYLLGKLYFSMNRFQDARSELREALRLSPQDNGIAYTAAMNDLKLKDVPPAQKIFRAMLARIGDSPKLHIAFAAAYRQTEYYDQALEELNKVRAKDPSYPRLHYYLAVTALPLLGRPGFPKAIQELKTELRYHPRDYDSNYLLGMLYVEQHELKESEPYLEASVRINPSTPDAALYLGQTYELQGRYADAIRLLRKSIQLTQDPSRNNYQIANAHYLLGQALLRSGEQEEAKKHLTDAAHFKTLQAAKAQANLQIYLGLANAKDESPQSGITTMEGKKIIVGAPPPTPKQEEGLRKGAQVYGQLAASAYNSLGLLRARQSDFERAADYFGKALDWDPKVPDTNYNLGLAEFKAQNYSQAVAPLEKAKAQQPDRKDVQMLLGMSYFFSENYAKAKDQLGTLVAGGSDDPQAIYALGLSLAHAGEAQAGETLLRGLVERYPQAADAHLALGQALALRNDFVQAQAEFAIALKLDPTVPEAHYYLGLTLLRKAKFSEAADEFRKEISRDPQESKPRYHLGLCLLSMNQIDEAIQAFDNVIRLNPSYAEAYYELGKARLGQGKTQEALSLLEKAAQLAGDKSYIQYQLFQAYLKAGKDDAARTALARYRLLKAREHNKRGGHGDIREP